ncbi:MAG: hypothetical protein M0Z65_07695 [Firmicutes bacterium]|nr:hypothetical protein [Bacillota bacterium]
MTGWILKLIICPIVILLSDFMFSDLSYPSPYSVVLTGAILALANHFMEVAMLRPGTFWISNMMDFLTSVTIISVSSWMIPGARAALPGILLTAFLLTVTEYFQHLWLLRSDKTEKMT